MSEGSSRRRDWRLYVTEMIEFCERVESYTDGLDFDSFMDDRRTYDATIRNLELIGEAASQMPRRVREAHPAIPWRRAIDMRNRVIHDYMGIDNDTVWTVVRNDVPALLAALRAVPLDPGAGPG